MSFWHTRRQFLDGTKTVTRRLGWKFLRPDDRFCAVEKAQGLKKGERVKRLGVCRVVSVRRERLDAITKSDVTREGFPDKSTWFFVTLFSVAMKCSWHDTVTRIEFEREGCK